ncbi:MAG: hypothetical protein ACRDRW_13275 [Pseudonocardiaceae bacterium]
MPQPQSQFEAEEMAQIQQYRAYVRTELDQEIQWIMMRVDQEIIRAQTAAEELIREGNTGFSMTGKASVVPDAYYPQTENWQKTIGKHKVWSHSKVHVDGDTVTMQITVQGEDRYNFNRGQHDIATDAPDNENGRFTELGWAKPFDTHGSLTRTVTWQLGHVPDTPTPDNPRQRR